MTTMKLVIVSTDTEVRDAAQTAFKYEENVEYFDRWQEGLDAATEADLMIVDLVDTLQEPHKIAGYEQFAHAKMGHPKASKVPLVVLSPPPTYELDFMSGWPDFVFAQLRKPIQEKVLRRVVTYL